MSSPVKTTGNGSPSIIAFPGVEPRQEPSGVLFRHITGHYRNVKHLELRAGAIGHRTYEHLDFLLLRFEADYGGLEVADAPPRLLTEWLLRHPEWRSTARKHDAIAAVMSALRAAVDDDLIERNPLRRPRHLGPPTQPRPELTRAEYLAIKNAAREARTRRKSRPRTGGYFRAGLLFLWLTGARTKEMREARWDQVDWDASVIRLTDHKTRRHTGQDRLIPIGHILPLMRWLLRQRKPGQDLVFVSSLGRPLTTDRYAKEFRRFATLAGVDKSKSAYCCRHALCCRLVEAGHSDQAVADVLGHRTKRFVQWYGKATRGKATHLNRVMRGRNA